MMRTHVLLTALIATTFSACSKTTLKGTNSGSQSPALSAGNGTGYSGKLSYYESGACPGTVAIKTHIDVYLDSAGESVEAELLRENCMAVAPRSLAIGKEVTIDDMGTVQYQSSVLMAAPVNTTCRGIATEDTGQEFFIDVSRSETLYAGTVVVTSVGSNQILEIFKIAKGEFYFPMIEFIDRTRIGVNPHNNTFAVYSPLFGYRTGVCHSQSTRYQ